MGSCSSGRSGGTSNGNSSCCSKDLVRVLAIVGLILILLVGKAEGERATKTTTTTTTTRTTTTANFAAAESVGEFKGKDQQAVVGTQKLVSDPKLERINYMSKRRVPNGPDPIHNRRAGKSGRLPGQA